MKKKSRGYFGIGIYCAQHDTNIGTLFRSAYAFGASFIYTIGRPYHRQSSDTPNSVKHIPYFAFASKKEFLEGIPKDCRLVCVEIASGSRSLPSFCHPERAVYLLGSEGGGLPPELLEKNLVVEIPTEVCLNVASCGTVVLYDRQSKARE